MKELHITNGMDGQDALIFLPHTSSRDLCAREEVPLEYARCFVGALHYLSSLHCGSSGDYVCSADGTSICRSAFPSVDLLPEHREEGSPLFPRDDYPAAFRYFSTCLDDEMTDRFPSRSRALTLQLRFRVLLHLYCHVEHPQEHCAMKIQEWLQAHHDFIREREWFVEQQEALAAMQAGLEVDDANDIRESQWLLHIAGDPCSGKSEVVVHPAVRVADAGLHVNVPCRSRLPASDSTIVETRGCQISRKADMVVEYSPPSRHRHYDLFLIDEESQIEDHIAHKLWVGVAELPQKAMVIIAADFRQLRPVDGGSMMKEVCDRLRTVVLRTIHRTRDKESLDFLRHVRLYQILRSCLEAFFHGRNLSGDLRQAVAMTVAWTTVVPGRMSMWLCVTNAGADRVNAAVLANLAIDSSTGVPGDPKVYAGPIAICVGLCVRPTRNLDKDHGFVNGAIGVIEVVWFYRWTMVFFWLA